VTPERWREVDRLFAAALETPPSDRHAWLERAADGDAELLREVEGLLAADESGTTAFLERPADDLASLGVVIAGEDDDGMAGERLGPYRLEVRIGRGGMGAVYLAARDDGQYASRVAVKILRRDLGAEVRQRFLAERQILARLEHSNIARLYDGGTTPDGRPYLVMEHVEGLPLDADCDRRRLSLDARLELFGRICLAVHHAHQNLLVHRDLKPGNILVTPAGEPKLLDFGIAKELAPPDPDTDALETRTGMRVMTPAYASPEQVRGDAVTTASDVYALGVLLYELLAGVGPYRVGTASVHDLERAICDQEPDRPSSAVLAATASAEVAMRRGASLRELRRQLRGDLDTIVLKALRKDPSRRYGSAAELAQDLERHRRRQLVSARPDSFAYRTATFVRRHQLGVAAAGLALAVLAGLLVRLEVQRRSAARDRDKARQALALLVGVIENADPYKTGGRRLTARDVLDQGARRVSRELAAAPEVQAELMDAIGRAYLGIGSPEQSAPLLARAFELRRTQGAEPLELAASVSSLAQLREQQGRYAEAARFYRQVLVRQQEVLGEPSREVALTLDRLGNTYAALDRFGEAEGLHRRALAAWHRLETPAGEGTAGTLVLLAQLAKERGRLDEAEALYAKAVAIERRALDPRDPELASTLSLQALVHIDHRGDLEGGEKLLLEALSIQRQALEPGHPALMDTMNRLAVAYYTQGKMARAEALYREVLAQYRVRLGAHPRLATVLHNLGSAVQARGAVDEAILLHGEGLAMRRQVLGARHHEVAASEMFLARAHFAAGHLREAEALFRQALELSSALMGPEHTLPGYVLWDLGRVLVAAGRPAEAEGLFRRSLAIREATLPAKHFELARTRSELGGCLVRLRRFRDAEALLLPAEAALDGQFPGSDKRVMDVRKHLSALYRAWKRESEARRYEAAASPLAERLQ
jgi:serine/threonine protein kinase/Tfp pilus assembly protein PilF